MSTSDILLKVAHHIDQWKESNASLDTLGGRPETGVVSKLVTDFSDLFKKFPIKANDLVCLSTSQGLDVLLKTNVACFHRRPARQHDW